MPRSPLREEAARDGVGHDGAQHAGGGAAHSQSRGTQVARGRWNAVVEHGPAAVEHAHGASAQALPAVLGGANALVCPAAGASSTHGAVQGQYWAARAGGGEPALGVGAARTRTWGEGVLDPRALWRQAAKLGGE